MKSSDLKPEHVRRLARIVARQRNWLEALSGRMHQKRFPADDPLKLAGDDALRAMAKLDDVMRELQRRAGLQT